MKEEREEKIYKSLMLVVITVIITFLITSVTVYKAIAKNGIKYVKITDGEVTGLDETLASFRKVLEKEYLGEIEDETLVEGALKGYVEALGDPYTEYYTKEEALARELMDSKYGYQLMSDYPAMFELGGQGSANKEIIWATAATSWGGMPNDMFDRRCTPRSEQNGMGCIGVT